MKKITVMLAAVMAAGIASAALYTQDFSSVSWGSAGSGGRNVYTDYAPYDGSVWYGVRSNTNNFALNLNAHEDGVERGAGTVISAATFGTNTTLSLTFFVNVAGQNGTATQVEIWEGNANGGATSYTNDVNSGGGAFVLGDAVSRLGGAEYINADGDGTKTITFTRLDTSADVILMFTATKNATWKSGSIVDDLSIDVIPEPATLGLVAAFGGGILFIRRRLLM